MQTTDLALTLSIREETPADGIAATLDGIAVPYGSEIDLGGVREVFAAGAFDPAEVIGRPLCWRHDEPIGKITDARNEDGGLIVTAEIADTTLGRDASALVRSGAVSGLSVGFEPVEDSWDRGKTIVTRAKARLRELSLTHLPAYAQAGVSVIREEETTMSVETVEETPAVSSDFATREDLVALRDRVASITVIEREVAAPSMEDYLRDSGKRLVTRAWTNVTLDGTAADVTPLPVGIANFVNAGRPLVSAIGVSPLAAEGMDAAWMLDKTPPTVSVQSGEKTEIASTVPAGELVKAPVVTYAGGNDVSLQFIARASVWDYSHLMALYAREYARATNAAVATSMAAATQIMSVPAALTADILGGLLGKGAADIVAGTGNTPSAIVLDPSLFFKFAVVTGNGFPLAGGNVGNADLSGLSFTAFGLPFVCDPTIVGGYMFDRSAIGIKENPGAPLSITVNVPSKLGIDYAVYGFLSHKVLNAAGIVKVVGVAPTSK
jgi:HK97 family phage prohead protease